ncbi:MAG TPA: hypothetical protein VFI86_04775 [Burkholderiales bacterium]|nr:hypothetical protein [Burkholderiales bacterium]
MPSSHAVQHYPHGARLSRWAIVGFLSGAAAVLVFHQGTVALFHLLDLTGSTPYSLHATPPWGVPQVWSLAFWGGVWGVLLALALARLHGAALPGWGLVFGAILPTLVAWFVVAPLKGHPAAGGFAPAAMALALVANGLWGLGTGIGLALFGRHHEAP